MGRGMATAADITIRIIPATPSRFTIHPAIRMGIAGLTIAAGIDMHIATAAAIAATEGIIIATGKTTGNAISSGLSFCLWSRKGRARCRAFLRSRIVAKNIHRR